MDLEILFEQLKDFEGLELKPYRCTSDKLTIGLGRNLEDNGITEEEAYYLAENDIDNLMDELDRNIPWWTELNNPRKRALLNMAYNVGTPTLMKFQKTLGLLESGQYEEASKEVLNSRWARQVGRRADFISNVFLTGSEE
jgi:lysozyme